MTELPNHNPFAPPQSQVADDPNAPPGKPRRIFALQIFASLVGVFLGVHLGRDAWAIAQLRKQVPVRLDAQTWAWQLFYFLLVVGSFTLVVILQRRSPWVRWMAIGWLLAMMICQFVLMPSPPDPATRSFSTVSAHYTGLTVIETPMALLIYFAGVSKKARKWFDA